MFPEPGNEQREVDLDQFDKLLNQARQGDQSALGRLLDDYRDYLLLVANQAVDRQIRGKVGCSDIVQESMMTAHDRFSDFEGDDQQHWRAWLRKIVVHDVYEARRRFKKTEKRQVQRERPIQVDSSMVQPLVDTNSTPKSNAIAAEEAERLAAAMAKLSDDYRAAIRLRNWEQLSFEEVGKRLNRSEEAARKLWTRALLKLQEVLADVENEA